MKRVKAACILQTLVFAQKDDCGLTHEQQLKVNHDEVSVIFYRPFCKWLPFPVRYR